MINGADGSILSPRFSLRLFSSSSLLLYLCIFSSLTASATAAPGFWSKIYDYPTPSPEDGPPGAAHASRNKRLLPYQICGILGGYLGFVLISLLLLLTVGRRLRQNAEMSPASLEMDIIKHAAPAYVDETPISPATSTRSWFRGGPFRKSGSVRGDSMPTSPTGASVSSFDQSVLENDRESRQREMERLYAAVMEHDARKSQQRLSEQTPPEATSEEEQEEEQQQQTQPQSADARVKADKRPPRLVMKPHNEQNQRGPLSPVQNFSQPLSPRSNHSVSSSIRSSSIRSTSIQAPPYNDLASPRQVPLPMSPNRMPSSPRSLLSPFRSESKARKALKSLRISGPIRDYPGVAVHDEMQAPLSPRHYQNLPPPPSPPKDPAVHRGSNNSTPRTLDYSYEDRDTLQPLPMPRGNPLRSPLATSFPQDQQQQQQQQTASPLSFKSTASSTNQPLPFRSYSADNAAVPPTPTKVTYLERRREQLNLMTPRTGVPSTPYSPYMPFTPITPVTPHLPSKKEMKARKKMEGRRVADSNDLVRSEKDLWDSGY